MAVDHAQERNKANLKELINAMMAPGNKGPHEIVYSESQSGKVILLGWLHNTADERLTEGGYKGKLEIQEESSGSILVTIKPAGGAQKGGRLELQMYVLREIENLPTPYPGVNKWNVRTKWA